MKRFFTILAVLLSATMAFAQMPQTMSYQGVLHDNAGAPYQGNHALTFSLFDAQTMGTQVWTETHTDEPITDGVFSVILGAPKNGTAAPLNITFDKPYYLEITIDGNTLPTRMPLTAVPYALNAGDSHSHDGEGANSFLGGGTSNLANGSGASVIGGHNNRATKNRSAVVGGGGNAADGFDSFIGGGIDNEITGELAFIGGGEGNAAQGEGAAVVGGGGSYARGKGSVVLGGLSNQADGPFSVVTGGAFHKAPGARSAVVAGSSNTASGDNSVALGGGGNRAEGLKSLAAGSRATAGHNGAIVFQAHANANDQNVFSSTGENQFLINALGGVGIGKNDPQSELDVAGTVTATGLTLPTGATDGYVLTTDANGVATWQEAQAGDNHSHDGEGENSFIGGGTNNQASGTRASVMGGIGNKASALNSVVVGGENNEANGEYSFIGSGIDNETIGESAFVGGGTDNSAEGKNAAVVGGNNNTVTGSESAVVGGTNNKVNGSKSSVLGGNNNEVLERFAAVVGGSSNTIDGESAFIGGGETNTAADDYAFVGGGEFGKALASHSAVLGGSSNTASGNRSVVVGGQGNKAEGLKSFAAGSYATAGHNGSIVFQAHHGVHPNDAFSSTGENQFLINALGGVGIGKNDPQSELDVAGTVTATGLTLPTGATDGYVLTTDANGVATWQEAQAGDSHSHDGEGANSFLGGGSNNQANGSRSSVLGGLNNQASDYNSVVAGGKNNTADGEGAFIGGGETNTANGEWAFVGGGELGKALGSRSAVVAGGSNVAIGHSSVVVGGRSNRAEGLQSFAAGTRATAGHDGAIVFQADHEAISNGIIFSSTGENQFLINALGGVGIGKNDPQSELDVAGTVTATGLTLPTGATDGYVLTTDANGVATWQAAPTGGASVWSVNGNNTFYNTGHVGVGKDNPQTPLDVSGKIRSSYVIDDTNVIELAHGGANAFINWTGEGNLDFRRADTNLMTLDQSGNLSVNGLKLATGATGGYVLTSDANGVATWQAPSDAWSVDGDDIFFNTGNVGINKSLALTPLDVAGIIRATYNSDVTERIEMAHGGANAYINWAGNGNLDFRRDGDNLMTLNQSGKLLVNSIVGGTDNQANGNNAFIGGGRNNTASGEDATVGSGRQNDAAGAYSVVPGGRANRAFADYSFAAGRAARAHHAGTFVWADNNGGYPLSFDSTSEDQFLIRAQGGVGIGTNNPQTPFALRAPLGTHDVGITQGQVGGDATMELTTADESGAQATRMMLRGASDQASVEFYSGARGSEVETMRIDPNGVVTANNFQSQSGDFAEYLPRLNADEHIVSGDLVGVFGGKVSRQTAGAERVMVVSDQAVVTGNVPSEDNAHLYETVGFIGQVRTHVRGIVEAGDYIIASGEADGTGVAVHPHDLKAEHLPMILGRAWEAKETEDVARVNVSIGLSLGDAQASLFAQMTTKVAQMTTAMAELRQANEQLQQTVAHMATMKAQMATMQAMMEKMMTNQSSELRAQTVNTTARVSDSE